MKEQIKITSFHKSEEYLERQADAKARAKENIKPDFWITRLDEIEDGINAVKLGKVTELRSSAGGRKIYMVEYGTDNVNMGKANLSSALGAHSPKCYADKSAPDYVPTLFLVGCVHGGEFEGTASLMNLIKLIETGTDYSGKRNDRLVELCKKLHLLIIPMANPDGRSHIPFDSFVGHSEYDLRYYNQGTWKDGTLCNWPDCKKVHPIKDYVDYLGGYYNDDGINLMHDFFFGDMSNETRNILDVCSDRAPDFSVLFHGGTNSPTHLTYIGYTSGKSKAMAYDLVQKMRPKYLAEGLKCDKCDWILGNAPDDKPVQESFNLPSAMHHCCGTPCITYESNQGIADNGYFEDEADIYRAHSIMLESVAEWLLTPFVYPAAQAPAPKPKKKKKESKWAKRKEEKRKYERALAAYESEKAFEALRVAKRAERESDN